MSTDPNSALHTLEQEKQQKHNGQVQRQEGRRRRQLPLVAVCIDKDKNSQHALKASSTPPRRSLKRARPSSSSMSAERARQATFILHPWHDVTKVSSLVCCVSDDDGVRAGGVKDAAGYKQPTDPQMN
jgi:hypothetical protein